MKTILLTGISQGLGKAIYDFLASELYAKDEKIYITRNRPKDIVENHLSNYVHLDFLNPNLDFEQISPHHNSKAIILISNAAIIEPIKSVSDINITELENAMRINCIAPFILASHLTKKAYNASIPLLIINISSGAANKPIQGWAPYCMGKAAVKMAFDVIAKENPWVEVLHFDPGVMDTNMQTIIRASSETVMPALENFKRYKNDNLLKSPVVVAEEISQIIQRRFS